MAGAQSSRQLLVHAKRRVARDVVELDLRPLDGGDLPVFTAGAHVSVQTPGGPINKYSLCNCPTERHRYVIAVRRDAKGAGGSLSLADQLEPGQFLNASDPENAFELSTARPQYLFIAGGIGITPIYAMIQSLIAAGQADFQLVYLTRSPEDTPYWQEIIDSPWADRMVLHHTHGVAADRFDLWPLLERQGRRQIYCCGPRRLMEEVRAMTGHWAGGTVHFESFGVDETLFKPNVPFAVHLQARDMDLQVDAATTLLQALDAHGVHVPRSCESGTCGTCKTPLISGEVEHRDMVLDEGEQASNIMVCVSRGTGGKIVLDL